MPLPAYSRTSLLPSRAPRPIARLPVFPGQKNTRPVTNIRNTGSRHWTLWLKKPEQRCLVPVTSFAEPDRRRLRCVWTWFAQDESRPLMFFAGTWREWEGLPRHQGRRGDGQAPVIQFPHHRGQPGRKANPSRRYAGAATGRRQPGNLAQCAMGVGINRCNSHRQPERSRLCLRIPSKTCNKLRQARVRQLEWGAKDQLPHTFVYGALYY